MRRLSKSKGLVSGFLAVLLPAVLLFSAFYAAREADHNCTGEDCPICACIRQCENTLQQIRGGIAIRFAALIPTLLLLFAASLLTYTVCRGTPVSRKVRLNN